MLSLPSPPEMKSAPPRPLIVSWLPKPKMQSDPADPTKLSLFGVPRITLEPAGQQLGSSPKVPVTVTTWVAVTKLSAASTAVQVTTVVPSGNVAGASLL